MPIYVKSEKTLWHLYKHAGSWNLIKIRNKSKRALRGEKEKENERVKKEKGSKPFCVVCKWMAFFIPWWLSKYFLDIIMTNPCAVAMSMRYKGHTPSSSSIIYLNGEKLKTFRNTKEKKRAHTKYESQIHFFLLLFFLVNDICVSFGVLFVCLFLLSQAINA